MRCFACDCDMDNPPLDRNTGRYYCSSCMEFTNETILALEGKDHYLRPEIPVISLDDLQREEDREELKELEDSEFSLDNDEIFV